MEIEQNNNVVVYTELLDFMNNAQLTLSNINIHKVIDFLKREKKLPKTDIDQLVIDLPDSQYLTQNKIDNTMNIIGQFTLLLEDSKAIKHIKIKLKDNLLITKNILNILEFLQRFQHLEAIEIDLSNNYIFTNWAENLAHELLKILNPVASINIDLSYTFLSEEPEEIFLTCLLSQLQNKKEFQINLNNFTIQDFAIRDKFLNLFLENNRQTLKTVKIVCNNKKLQQKGQSVNPIQPQTQPDEDGQVMAIVPYFQNINLNRCLNLENIYLDLPLHEDFLKIDLDIFKKLQSIYLILQNPYQIQKITRFITKNAQICMQSGINFFLENSGLKVKIDIQNQELLIKFKIYQQDAEQMAIQLLQQNLMLKRFKNIKLIFRWIFKINQIQQYFAGQDLQQLRIGYMDIDIINNLAFLQKNCKQLYIKQIQANTIDQSIQILSILNNSKNQIQFQKLIIDIGSIRNSQIVYDDKIGNFQINIKIHQENGDIEEDYNKYKQILDQIINIIQINHIFKIDIDISLVELRRDKLLNEEYMYYEIQEAQYMQNIQLIGQNEPEINDDLVNIEPKRFNEIVIDPTIENFLTMLIYHTQNILETIVNQYPQKQHLLKFQFDFQYQFIDQCQKSEAYLHETNRKFDLNQHLIQSVISMKQKLLQDCLKINKVHFQIQNIQVYDFLNDIDKTDLVDTQNFSKILQERNQLIQQEIIYIKSIQSRNLYKLCRKEIWWEIIELSKEENIDQINPDQDQKNFLNKLIRDLYNSYKYQMSQTRRKNFSTNQPQEQLEHSQIQYLELQLFINHKLNQFKKQIAQGANKEEQIQEIVQLIVDLINRIPFQYQNNSKQQIDTLFVQTDERNKIQAELCLIMDREQLIDQIREALQIFFGKSQ